MSAILIGMMGSGKTTLGRAAASSSGLPFRDLDIMITQGVGETVARIIKERGEQEFRCLESAGLLSLRGSKRMILSVGGGAPMNPSNFVVMREIGKVVYLRAPTELLVERLRRSQRKRPLLQGGDLEGKVRSLLEERKAVYEQADVILDVEGRSKLELAERIADIARAHR